VVAVALGLAGVAAAWWLGTKAYGTVAGFVAAAATAVATTHVAYSRMAVTDIPLTLGVTAALALALSGRLEWAGIATGLAASAKYPGVLLAVPLLVAGWAQWRRLAVAAGLAFVAFAVTSPFVLVHPLKAADDALEVRRLAHEGWLGFEHDGPTPLAFADRLWEALGPALVLAAIGLALALARRRRADALSSPAPGAGADILPACTYSFPTDGSSSCRTARRGSTPRRRSAPTWPAPRSP
jgi:hypothetical protein